MVFQERIWCWACQSGWSWLCWYVWLCSWHFFSQIRQIILAIQSIQGQLYISINAPLYLPFIFYCQPIIFIQTSKLQYFEISPTSGNMKNYNHSAETLSNNKTYLQHINFDKPSRDQVEQHQSPQQHMPIYTPHSHSNSAIKPNLPIAPISNTINRNPYLNIPLELKKEPPRYNAPRNNSNKEMPDNRQSQELLRNKTYNFKNMAKNQNLMSKNDNSSIGSSINKSHSNQPSGLDFEFNSNYSQTVDLGSISRKQSINQSVTNNEEEEQLREKLKYLQLLEYSIRQFQSNTSVNVLKSFNENNRVFLVTYFEKINRIREEIRRNSNDCYTESDNTSQDNFFMDDNVSDSRNNSLKIQSEKPKIYERVSKSREKSNEKANQLNLQLKVRQKLQKELQQLSKRKGQESQLQKLQQKIKKIQQQSNKLITKNQQLKVKLSTVSFYDSWVVMCAQAEGAKKTSKRLKEQLQKRKEVLKRIKEKKPQENNGFQNQMNQIQNKQISRSIDNKFIGKTKPQKYVIGQIGKKQMISNRGSHENSTKPNELTSNRAKSTNRFSN